MGVNTATACRVDRAESRTRGRDAPGPAPCRPVEEFQDWRDLFLGWDIFLKMSTTDVILTVRGVAAGFGDESPLVVLQDDRKATSLRVPVGPYEASSIILELEGVLPLRPLTHDLMASFFRDHGFRMECARIYDAEPDPKGGERFLAQIRYRRGIRRWRKEVRPSDAIALALRLGAPIFAPREFLDRREASRLQAPKENRLPLYLQVAPRA